jgi:hypothetical protein
VDCLRRRGCWTGCCGSRSVVVDGGVFAANGGLLAALSVGLFAPLLNPTYVLNPPYICAASSLLV